MVPSFPPAVSPLPHPTPRLFPQVLRLVKRRLGPHRNHRFLSEILGQHCGKSAADVSRDSDRDFFMGPAEAKAYGLIDEIVQTSK